MPRSGFWYFWTHNPHVIWTLTSHKKRMLCFALSYRIKQFKIDLEHIKSSVPANDILCNIAQCPYCLIALRWLHVCLVFALSNRTIEPCSHSLFVGHTLLACFCADYLPLTRQYFIVSFFLLRIYGTLLLLFVSHTFSYQRFSHF